MTDFLDQYARQFRAAAEKEASRGRRVSAAPLAVAGLAAAAVAVAVVGNEADTVERDIDTTPRKIARPGGFGTQRRLLRVLRIPTRADRDPQVRGTVREYRDLGPRTARLLGFTPSGGAYVLLATREYEEFIQPRPPIEPGEDFETRTHRNGLCLIRQGTQGDAVQCLGTAAIRAGLLAGAAAGEVYGVVPDGVTHVVPPRGHPPVRVRRNFYRYPARGNPGPAPIWLDTRGDEVLKVPADGELPFLNYSGYTNLAAYRGRVAVVGLWASWCKPCETQLRVLQRLHERVTERGDAEVFGVATRDLTAPAQRTIERTGVRFAVLSDPKGREAERFGSRAFPETFVLAPDGKIAASFRGPVTLEQLEEAVSRAG